LFGWGIRLFTSMELQTNGMVWSGLINLAPKASPPPADGDGDAVANDAIGGSVNKDDQEVDPLYLALEQLLEQGLPSLYDTAPRSLPLIANIVDLLQTYSNDRATSLFTGIVDMVQGPNGDRALLMLTEFVNQPRLNGRFGMPCHGAKLHRELLENIVKWNSVNLISD
jgi:hypothetical protein